MRFIDVARRLACRKSAHNAVEFEPMRLGMLGCGYVANMYRLTLPLHPELDLVGVADIDPARAHRMAELVGRTAYTGLAAMLDDPRVEIVLNLTNPRYHYETTLACLEAGKHVYSEKPLALELDQARRLVELAERKGLILSSAPCTLLNEAAQTLWKAIREGQVGPIRLVYAEMDDGMVNRMPVSKWINEAGIPWPYVDEFETGCTLEHAGYVLTWLLAYWGPVESVSAFSTCLVQDKVPGEKINSAADFSVGCVKFKSGVIARLTCGLYAPVDHSLKIFGDDGVMILDDPRRDHSPLSIRRYITIRRSRMLTPWRKRYPTLSSGRKQVRYRGSQERDFCSGVADMAEAIRMQRPCRLSARFCLHVNELVLALHNAKDSTSPYRMTTVFDPLPPMPWSL